jgi:hypothetical protein
MLRRLCERYSEWSSHEEQPAFFSWRRCGSRPKRGCLLKLAYYAFPRWYEFGERRWNYILTGEYRRTRRKILSQCHFCPTQIPLGLTRTRNRASAVRGQWLTTWAMARPSNLPYFSLKAFLCPLKSLLWQYRCWHNLPKKHLMKWCRPSQPSSSFIH